MAEVKRRVEDVWCEGGCGTAPPDRAEYVDVYEEDFAARHAYVQHEIARDGFRIVAREFGAEHFEAGPTIVLMHGFPDNMHLYDWVAPSLSETHHVITFDFIGYGLSEVPGRGHDWQVTGLRRGGRLAGERLRRLGRAGRGDTG